MKYRRVLVVDTYLTPISWRCQVSEDLFFCRAPPCFNRSPSSDLDWVHLRRKLKYTMDNLLGNITLTRIIQQSLAWTLQNLLSFFNSSTMRTSTSESAHKLLCHFRSLNIVRHSHNSCWIVLMAMYEHRSF